MNKYLKKIIIVIIAVIYLSMLVSAVIVNVKYHKYVTVTEMDMSEEYDYENAGFSVKLDSYKCVTPEELAGIYPYTADIVRKKETDENIEIEDIILVYADINVYDYDTYKTATKKGDWTLFWSIEAENGWRNNTSLDLYRTFTPNIEEGEHQYIFAYIVAKSDSYDYEKVSPKEWNYKLQINKTPVVYYRLSKEKMVSE